MKMAGKCLIAVYWTAIFSVPAIHSLFAESEVRRAFPQREAGVDSSEKPIAPRAEIVQRSTSQSSPQDNPPPETIRIGSPEGNPASAAKMQLEGADSLYVKKMYDLAIPAYEKYLAAYPNGEERDAALFRLAESHRFLGYQELAGAGYNRLIREFPFGEFTGAAAYRLGEILFSGQNYDGALGQFRIAAQNVKKEEVRLAALFYQARCLGKLGYKANALALYKQVAGVKKDNPFHDDACLAAAQGEADTGQLQLALDQFDEVVKTATDPAMQAEASVRGAALAVTLNRPELAVHKFRDAIAINSPEWRSTAWLGLFQLFYQKGEYSRIISDHSQALLALSRDVRADGLLLVANSYRQLGHFPEATQVYDHLIQEFPQSQQASEAQFQRLVSLYSMNDPSVIEAIDAFEKQTADPLRRSQVLLLKVETLFRKKQFAEAAPFFREIQESGLPANFKSDALYKLGWCYAHSNQLEQAISTYSEFIKNYPENTLIPSALLQRGLARQQHHDVSGALNDYNSLITQYPQAHEREVALLQRGLLLGAQGDQAGMSQAFEQLLSDYPKSAAAAQANFWIGWAAYENKDYQNAIDYLNKARTLDKAHYQERATLRILLAYYYLKNAEAASREAKSMNSQNIPSEILRWLGVEYFQNARFADAEYYLQLLQKNHLSPNSPDSTSLDSEVSLLLAQAQLKLKKYSVAQSNIENYLATARDPVSRGEGLFIQAQVMKEEGKIEDALKVTHEVQLLQPEGMANARARLMGADLRMMQQDYSQAGRDYMAVALLYDDPKLAPQALKNAIQAFRQAHSPADEERAVAQLKKRFPESPP